VLSINTSSLRLATMDVATGEGDLDAFVEPYAGDVL